MEKGKHTQSSILADIPHLETRLAWREAVGDSDMSEETRLIIAKRISALAYRRIQFEQGVITEQQYQASVAENNTAISQVVELEAAIAAEVLRRRMTREGGI